MHRKTCLICMEPFDERGYCGCEPPFDMKDPPSHRLYNLAVYLNDIVNEFYADPKNKAMFEEFDREAKKAQAV